VFNERPTPRNSQDLTVYQGLLSVFDEMTTTERYDFIELAFLFKGLTPEERRKIIVEAEQFQKGSRT